MTARVSLLFALLVVVAGCGRVTTVRERDLLVRGSATAAGLAVLWSTIRLLATRACES